MSFILKLKELSKLDVSELAQVEEDELKKRHLLELQSLIDDIKALLSEPGINDENISLSDINGLLDSLDDLKAEIPENDPILSLGELKQIEEALMDIEADIKAGPSAPNAPEPLKPTR